MIKERKRNTWLTTIIAILLSMYSEGQQKDPVTKEDSLRNQILKSEIKSFYRNQNWDAFNKLCNEHLKLTRKIKDTTSHAKTLEYIGAYFEQKHKTDSSYYYYTKSFQTYNSINDSLNAGLILLNLAITQKNFRDYSGSEYKCKKALKYLTNRTKPRWLASVHNTLGVVYGKQNNFDLSLQHHLKSLELREQKGQNPLHAIYSLNNIGDMYIAQKKYDNAISYFNKANRFDSIIDKHPRVQATLQDNLTYAQFKNGGYNNLLASFEKALNLRKKIDDKYGMISSLLHISEYYRDSSDKEKAIEYAQYASKISKNINAFESHIRSLEFLGNLYDEKESKAIFNQYASIRDSLESVDKNQRNSFATIELMVDEKNEIIQEQNKKAKTKKLFINILLALLIITIIIAIYFIINQRQKKRLLNESYKELKDTKKALSDKVFNSQEVEEHLNEFHEFLQKKYELTDVLIEFWILRANRKTKEEMAKILFKSVNSIKDRRKRLIKILKEIKNISNPPRSFLIDVYNEELAQFTQNKNRKA